MTGSSDRLAQEERLAATAVYDALRAGEYDVAALMLHPYLHWTWPDGTVTRGRTEVMALLRGGGAAVLLAPAQSVELRDDQVYRWSSAP